MRILGINLEFLFIKEIKKEKWCEKLNQCALSKPWAFGNRFSGSAHSIRQLVHLQEARQSITMLCLAKDIRVTIMLLLQLQATMGAIRVLLWLMSTTCPAAVKVYILPTVDGVRFSYGMLTHNKLPLRVMCLWKDTLTVLVRNIPTCSWFSQLKTLQAKSCGATTSCSSCQVKPLLIQRLKSRLERRNSAPKQIQSIPSLPQHRLPECHSHRQRRSMKTFSWKSSGKVFHSVPVLWPTLYKSWLWQQRYMLILRAAQVSPLMQVLSFLLQAGQ